MSIVFRERLATGTRTLDFMRAHPFATDGEMAIVKLLEEHVVRGDVLLTQHRAGEIAVSAMSEHRLALTREIRQELLLPLSRAAIAASKEVPELRQAFRMPKNNTSQLNFRIAAHALAEGAQARKDLLLRYGMAPTLLDDLNKALTEYDTTLVEAHAGKRAHVGARADLEAVTDEILAIVRQLDGMNRYRFRNDPERLAAWKSARRVSVPSPSQKPAAGTAAA